MVNRKTAEQIKDEILSCLNIGPLSIEQIRLKVESNWSTVSNYLEELSKDGKVKEILSADRAKIYQRVFGDTYFNIPISDEERKKFRSLFSIILQEYKLKGETPTKTCFSKCAVHVIRKNIPELSSLPVVWYLYGQIPQMIADPSLDYSQELKFQNENKIRHIIVEFIESNKNRKTNEIHKAQHREYNEELYILADEFFDVLNKKDWKNEEILEILNKFFIACPVDKDFPEVFDLTEKVLSIIRKLSIMKVELQNHKKEILLLFDSLWKFIALYKLYISKITGPNAMEKDKLLNYYLGAPLEARKSILHESILELNSLYLQHLSNFDSSKIELPKEALEIRKIMAGWTGED